MPHTVAVTGATGHLGNVLVRRLLDDGHTVRVLVQPGDDLTPLHGLDVTTHTGDINDPQSLASAFTGATWVFHLAGLVSITRGQEEAMRRINIEGTRNVVKVCTDLKTSRLVYTGSVHALTEPTGPLLEETAGFDEQLAHGPYGKSKAAACALVQEAGKRGDLHAVLVLPSGVVGPSDYRLSEMGQMVVMAGQGKLPITLQGGYEWVDVRDVAEGLLLAATKGRSGEAYILNNARLSALEVARVVARAAGSPGPYLTLPLWFARLIALFGPLWESLTGRRALLTPYAVHTLGAHFSISNKKAREELGFVPRPLETSFHDAWHWLSTHAHSPLQRKIATPGPGRTLKAK